MGNRGGAEHPGQAGDDPGRPHRGERDAQQSLAIFRELGDRWGQLQAIEWLGAAQAATGDHAQAERLHRDGLRMAEELGLWPQAADALSWLGRGALRSGDLAQARELLERAMRLAAEQSYQPGQVFAEIGLGQTARRKASSTRPKPTYATCCRRASGSAPSQMWPVLMCPNSASSPSSAATRSPRAHGISGASPLLSNSVTRRPSRGHSSAWPATTAERPARPGRPAARSSGHGVAPGRRQLRPPTKPTSTASPP